MQAITLFISFFFSVFILSHCFVFERCGQDSTELRLEVQCSQSTCLDILRVGGDSANAWMISGISSQFLAHS